jgi:hypothetical protein
MIAAGHSRLDDCDTMTFGEEGERRADAHHAGTGDYDITHDGVDAEDATRRNNLKTEPAS